MGDLIQIPLICFGWNSKSGTYLEGGAFDPNSSYLLQGGAGGNSKSETLGFEGEGAFDSNSAYLLRGAVGGGESKSGT